MSVETRAALDEAIRAHAADETAMAGELIISWLVLVGTRNAEDGGAVLRYPSDGAMPLWLAKGLLAQATDGLRACDTEEDD